MKKSVYGCECGGHSVMITAIFVYWRECRACGKKSQAWGTKRAANKFWKNGEFTEEKKQGE